MLHSQSVKFIIPHTRLYPIKRDYFVFLPSGCPWYNSVQLIFLNSLERSCI